MKALALVLLLTLTATAGLFISQRVSTTSARTTDSIMSLTVSSGGICNGAGTCTVAQGYPFTLQIRVDTAPAEGYVAVQTELDYSELLANGGSYQPAPSGADEITWPDVSTVALRVPGSPTGSEGLVYHAGTTAKTPPLPASFHEGGIVRLAMTCSPGTSSSTLFLLPFAEDNTNGAGFRAYPSSANLNIPAKAAPLNLLCDYYSHYTDTDGDGCSDFAEMQVSNGSEMYGGRRDYLNPYDFYDTNGDRTIDLFIDIFGVADLFGADADSDPPGEPDGYDAAFDRSEPGPGEYVWDMHAPDGAIDLFTDIFGVAYQFGHDCNN